MLNTSRAQFALKDPSALAALLTYDWRQREMLTDAELFGEGRRPGALEGEAGPGLIRPLQRLGFIKPLHGVRPHGGRMRLWTVTDAMRIQIVADLRALSDLSINGAVRHLTRPDADALDAALAGWKAHNGAPGDHCRKANMRLEGLPSLPQGRELVIFTECVIARFVHRNRFDAVTAPAFLA